MILLMHITLLNQLLIIYFTNKQMIYQKSECTLHVTIAEPVMRAEGAEWALTFTHNFAGLRGAWGQAESAGKSRQRVKGESPYIVMASDQL